MPLLFVLADKLQRTHVGHLLEETSEVRDVVITQCQCHFLHRPLAAYEVNLGLMNALADDVVGRCVTGLVAEQTDETVFAKARRRSQLADRRRVGQILTNGIQRIGNALVAHVMAQTGKAKEAGQQLEQQTIHLHAYAQGQGLETARRYYLRGRVVVCLRVRAW